MSKHEKNQMPAGATCRYLTRLRREFAKELFSRLLKTHSGSLTMKTCNGVWHLTFSYKNETIKVQGKTLAHALINLTAKIPLTSPLTPEGGTRVLCEREGKHSAESKAPLLRRGGGEEFKTVAL